MIGLSQKAHFGNSSTASQMHPVQDPAGYYRLHIYSTGIYTSRSSALQTIAETPAHCIHSSDRLPR